MAFYLRYCKETEYNALIISPLFFLLSLTCKPLFFLLLNRFSCSYVEHVLEVFNTNMTEIKDNVTGKLFVFLRYSIFS